MPSLLDPQALCDELNAFLKPSRHVRVLEDEVERFDLLASEWRLSIEYGKLLFTAWNAAHTMTRRLEEIAYRDRGRLGVFAR